MGEEAVVCAAGRLVEALSVELVDFYLELLCRGGAALSRSAFETIIHLGNASNALMIEAVNAAGTVSPAASIRLTATVREICAIALVAESFGCASIDERCNRLLADCRSLLSLISGRSRPPSGAAVRSVTPPRGPAGCICGKHPSHSCERAACG
ncbi:MAG TPA: hypothetical protein VMW87_05850 [Spirochaetia bacterium]|nr:hypothetical protein [Spirochaetia bacterium]